MSVKSTIITIGILVGIIASLIAIYSFIFPAPPPPEPTPTPTPTFLERISGSYNLMSWTEAPSQITLYIDVKDGTLKIDETGDAIWDLGIQQRGEIGTPTSRIICKGKVSISSQQLVGGQGGEAYNWDSNIESVRDDVWKTFCGWSVEGYSDPFTLYIDEGGTGKKILEMKNSKGTFKWSGGDVGDSTQTPTPTSPKPTSQADLQIIDVRVEKWDQPGYAHQLVATVRNNGAGLASGFDGDCEWDCSWGRITHAGANIVQAGYISGNSQHTYTQPLNVQCEGSPTTLYFVCTIDYHNDVNETNENNNQWSGQVNIPW